MNKSFLIGVVLYNPKIEIFDNIVEKFGENNIIIFNNSNSEIILEKYKKLKVLGNGENLGVAYALNKFMEYAKVKKYRYLMFSDQDTIYPNNYLVDMVAALNQDEKFAAVFPGWIDTNSSQKTPKKQFVYSKFNLSLREPLGKYTHIAHGITSGMIIDLHKVEYLEFDESLFIDWVDTDWCWRLYRELNYKCVLVKDVILKHELGESSISFFGRKFTARNSLRDYYIIRNALYLLIYKNNLYQCNIYLFIKLIHHICFSFLYSLTTSRNMAYLALAINDGIMKKMYKKL